jgi:hypothetical protein
MTGASDALVVEDLALLLFNPRNGAVVGDGMPLFHVLAGAVLIDLVVEDRVRMERPRRGIDQVRTVGGARPEVPLLAAAWDEIDRKPMDVYTMVLVLGPRLREPVLDSLVDAGHLGREPGRGLFRVTRLVERDGTRRRDLVAAMRDVLADGAEPHTHSAALAALLSASGQLASMHAYIPWSGDVQTRGKELERSAWAATAAGRAVQVSMASLMATNLFTASSILGPS